VASVNGNITSGISGGNISAGGNGVCQFFCRG
jgi:hypothetical protein